MPDSLPRTTGEAPAGAVEVTGTASHVACRLRSAMAPTPPAP
ncbi:hypothetical protein FB559_7671 [Actinoallomurus bryophytorum]|uniref:Uncharacterized protein n=1 Tax=Actinoallomurus bryophytorum TaxID=1490222 RepID=A0A543BZY1_9ACTN|nr:hypothetical protein [Actinoallomurus bryophytorum]TQL90368.1 hypothetical protein FB559_7671 [Actinoallomurus bryophytorum]